MIKLRVEGTEKELNPLINRWARIGIPSQDICKTFKVKSISKFYPNKNRAEQMLNRESENGRVYLEIE
jgi:hypothetical protein